MIRLVIIDDEAPARLRARTLVAQYPEVLQLLGEADCARAGIELIEALRPDALLLDIQLPDQSGFELLAALSYQPMVVFTTAYSAYAVKAFETFAVDYLVKPLRAERFQLTVEQLQQYRGAARTIDMGQLQDLLEQLRPPRPPLALPIKKRDRIVLVEYGDIAYLKAEDKYVRVQLQDGSSHLLGRSLSQLEQELPEAFARVHRSYIVNTALIGEIHKYFKGRLILQLKDREQSSIISGASYTAAIKQLIGWT
ncbi:MAG: LytTR family DNA-binding domain-containing protein [Bacteroidota bacterium]